MGKCMCQVGINLVQLKDEIAPMKVEGSKYKRSDKK